LYLQTHKRNILTPNFNHKKNQITQIISYSQKINYEKKLSFSILTQKPLSLLIIYLEILITFLILLPVTPKYLNTKTEFLILKLILNIWDDKYEVLGIIK
jgi:hypothetical protein